jgi:hypothetical protein
VFVCQDSSEKLFIELILHPAAMKGALLIIFASAMVAFVPIVCAQTKSVTVTGIVGLSPISPKYALICSAALLNCFLIFKRYYNPYVPTVQDKHFFGLQPCFQLLRRLPEYMWRYRRSLKLLLTIKASAISSLHLVALRPCPT